MEDYAKYTIKEYKYWVLQLRANQSYLGHCVVYCKREGAIELPDANHDEQVELFQILRELREAADKLFQPDHFNYAFLGNTTKHLHCQFIPRYSSPREFAGHAFTDERFGQNYLMKEDFAVPEQVLSTLITEYKKVLG